MSNRVDRTGTFRFDKVLEAGVSLTKNQYPSFNIRVRLSEYWDEETGQWTDWSGYDVEQTAYFSLFGVVKKGKTAGEIEPTLNHQQITKVFGWDGRSFQVLGNDDYSKIKGQLRIDNNDPEYVDRNPFQVGWIDVFDADPVRQLRKLEASELKDLDAKFAHILQASGKAPKAATLPSRKATKPAPPKAVAKSEPEVKQMYVHDAVVETEDERKAKIAEKSKRLRENAETAKTPAPPARKPKPQEEVSPQEETGAKSYTKQTAWEILVEMKDDSTTDKQLNAAWGDAVDAVAGESDADDSTLTGEQWGEVVDLVLDTDRGDGNTIGKF